MEDVGRGIFVLRIFIPFYSFLSLFLVFCKIAEQSFNSLINQFIKRVSAFCLVVESSRQISR